MKIRILISLLISILYFNCGYALAAGPWKGKVVDSEAKEPLEGAVVLIVWDRAFRTPAGDNTYFYNAKEALTDKEGNFEIPSYTPINLLPIISYIKDPEFIIFKPGYGSLRMALGNYLTGEMMKTKEMEISGKIYRLSPGLIELPRLKTREERIESLNSVEGYPIGYAPTYKLKNLMQKIEIENRALGFKK